MRPNGRYTEREELAEEKGKERTRKGYRSEGPVFAGIRVSNPAAGSQSLGVVDKLLHFLSLGFLACKMGILLPTSLSSAEDYERIRRQSALWADKEG